MTHSAETVRANPIRFSLAKAAPLLPIYLGGVVVSVARLPAGLRLPMVLLSLALASVGVGLLWAWGKGSELTLSGGALELRSRWRRSSRVFARAGEHHGVRILTPPGREGPVPCIVWLDDSGHVTWMTRGHRWPLPEVERLAFKAGIPVSDGNGDSPVMSFKEVERRYPGSASWAERHWLVVVFAACGVVFAAFMLVL